MKRHFLFTGLIAFGLSLATTHTAIAGQGNNNPRFGRLFHSLPSLSVSDETLLLLGNPSSDSQNPAYMEDSQFRGSALNSEIVIGQTYVGQLLAHDISLDKTSVLGQHNQPESLANAASPWLDLDTVYDFDGTPAPRDPNDNAKLRLGNDIANDRDYPRDSEGHAIIADRRNDENNNIAQLTAIFIKLHNVFVDELRNQGVPELELFDQAKLQTQHHWQSVIRYEFLTTFLDANVWQDIQQNGRMFYKNSMAKRGMIPVEFAAAANRFGHSAVRGRYTLNANFDRVRLFPLSESELNRNLMGDVAIVPERQIDWKRFFSFDGAGPGGFDGLQVGRKIDRLLARPMLRLPIGGPGLPEFILDTENTVAGMPVVSLASLSFFRGKAVGLPSGQDVAQAMGQTPITNVELGLCNPGDPCDPVDGIELEESLSEAPLFLYLVEESRIQNQGEQLGTVGSRIIGEVVWGLLQEDHQSILNQTFVSPITQTDSVTMADIIRHIGWDTTPFG